MYLKNPKISYSRNTMDARKFVKSNLGANRPIQPFHHQQTMANSRQRDVEDLRESADMEKQILRRQAKQELEKVRSEMSVMKQENLMLQEDVQNMKEAQEKAPSAILKSLVEKLRNDLAEKDKKQRAMSRDRSIQCRETLTLIRFNVFVFKNT